MHHAQNIVGQDIVVALLIVFSVYAVHPIVDFIFQRSKAKINTRFYWNCHLLIDLAILFSCRTNHRHDPHEWFWFCLNTVVILIAGQNIYKVLFWLIRNSPIK